MDEEIKAVTSKLTAVVRLVTSPTGSSDASLISAFKAVLVELDSIGTSALTNNDQLGQMIMFPIFRLLQRDVLSDGLTEMVFKIMSFVFRCCWISTLKPTIACQLLDVILYLIGGSQDSPKQPSEHFLMSSDETRLAAVEVLQALYVAALQSNIVDAIMSSPMSISYNITVLLNCVEKSCHNVDLQASAIETLTLLCFSIIQSADKLSIMLPGLMSSFTKLLAGKYGKPHFKVKAASYGFVGQLIVTVFEDSSFTEKERKFRTDSWLKGTKEQIKQALASISNTVSDNDRPEVMVSLTDLYQSIIIQCPVSLDNCLHICIDGILKLSSDEKIKMRAVNLFSESLTKEVKKELEITFYDKIEGLSRTLTARDASVPLNVLNSMTMMLSMSSVDDSLLVDPLIQKLISSIQLKTKEKQINVIGNDKFEPSSAVAEIASRNEKFILLEELGLDSQLSPSVQYSIGNLLETVGENSQVALSLTRRIFSEITEFANQMVGSDFPSNFMLPEFWILLALTKGLVKRNRKIDVSEYLNFSDQVSTEMQSLVLDILDFSTETIIAAGRAENYTVSNAKTMVPYVSMSLELTGLTAEYLGPEFKHTLVETLYPVISMLSHPHPQVVNSARRAVIAIAKSCDYSSVRNLLIENVDYLLDGVSVRLNTLDITPQTPHLLSTFIELTGPAVVEHMNDIIDSLFVILDNFHGYHKLTEGIFTVFQVLIQQASVKYDIPRIENKPESRFYHIESIEQLIEVLNEKPIVDQSKFHMELPTNELESDEPNLEDYDENGLPKNSDKNESKPMGNEDEKEKDEWDSIISKPVYMILKKIIEYCSNFLIHSSSSLRAGLLLTIDKGIPLLATSAKEFLPLVNSYWPSVVDLLKDERIFIVEAATSCIASTCVYADDFMTGRIANLWSANGFGRLLCNKRMSQLPKYSDQARLLLALADCLTAILMNTRLPPAVFDSILSTMISHVDDFPDLLHAFQLINEDAVWLEKRLLSDST